MALEVGERLPEATLQRVGPDGPEDVKLSDVLSGRKVVLFALPGAFTRTCSSAHLPSFMRTADDFKSEGVDEIVCLSVNDPFVMKAWDEQTGASGSGVTMLADPDGAFTRAVGQDFSAPPVGLYGRSNRYALLVEDGVVRISQLDEPGVCDVSTGEKMLDTLRG